MLRLCPKTLLSRITGVLSRIPLPTPLRPAIFGLYARRYGVDLEECDRPLREYPDFASFFGRGLKEGARPLGEGPLLSPVDGRVVTSGPIREGRILQVKGVDYPLEALCAGLPSLERFMRGTQCTLYLSPGDYHRIHAPCTGRITAWTHLPGNFFPVNPPAVRSIPSLFCRNERVGLLLEGGPLGAVILVAVAALNVGDIRLEVLPGLRTTGARKPSRGAFDHPPRIEAGDLLGTFLLGSTVVLLFEEGRIAFPGLAPGDRVLQGRPLGHPLGTPGSG